MKPRFVASLYNVTRSSFVSAMESTIDIYIEIASIVRGDFSSKKNHLANVEQVVARSCSCHSSPNCRAVHNGVVWTNFLVIPAALVYFSKGWLVAAMTVLCSGTASFLFHVRRENPRFFLLDAAMAATAFFATVPSCILLMDCQQFAITIAILVIAFWFKGNEAVNAGRNYEFHHAMWHATIAVGQLFLATACSR